MSEDNTPKQREKKIKTSTLVSKSWAMRSPEQDNTELQDVMEASEFNRYLSLLGRKLIKKSLESDIPLDLKATNQMVLEKEDSGYLQRQGKPKKGNNDEDDGIEKEDKNNVESDKDDVGKEDGGMVMYMQQLLMTIPTLPKITISRTHLSSLTVLKL